MNFWNIFICIIACIIAYIIAYIIGIRIRKIIDTLKKIKKNKKQEASELNKIIIDLDNLFDKRKNLSTKCLPLLHGFDANGNLLFGCSLSAEDVFILLQILQMRTLETKRIRKYIKIFTDRIYNILLKEAKQVN